MPNVQARRCRWKRDGITRLRRITFETLEAFQADLEARGLADRVITLVYSEFGRRPEQYGSGTDHGAAGSAFVMGTQVKGEMVGEWPGLAQLDEDDNIIHTADFRSLYCSILEQWFDVDATQIIPGPPSSSTRTRAKTRTT